MKHPVGLTILGNFTVIAGFLLIGPATFIPIKLSIPIVYGMYGVMSIGNALYSVSTYGRAHNAAMRLGFNDDINTYLLISSEMHFNRLLNGKICTLLFRRYLDKFILSGKLCRSNTCWFHS